jgi:hypothetical protein
LSDIVREVRLPRIADALRLMSRSKWVSMKNGVPGNPHIKLGYVKLGCVAARGFELKVT